MQRIALPQDWTLSPVSSISSLPDTIPAKVPGCVHTDLLAANLIPDPYYAENEVGLQWIGRTDWRYQTSFHLDADFLAHESIDLVCEGLDTIAAIELNGTLIAETANMHQCHRLAAKDQLQVGQNTIVVTFTSALNYAEAQENAHGPRPHVEKHPFNYIRKMACNFGWDWGPTLITAGIWQPIYLQGWNTARIDYVRPLVLQADADLARLQVNADLAVTGTETLVLTAKLTAPNGKVFMEDHDITASTSLTLDIPEPARWWPRGHGDQPLYDLAVTISLNEKTLDTWQGRVGLRTVQLNTTADDIGRPLTLEVNGKAVFCKGANWIPDDCFVTRIDEARYQHRLNQAAEANMNMLRIWGGGIYENETFYRLCDEMGLMVWQDFLFACAAYPEEAPYDALVEAEARHQIARLSAHPSLVLWNGCNENIWGYFDWGWQGQLGERTWGLGYYLDLFPRLVQELDPSRPYWPGSPYSGSMDIHPLDDDHGNKHIWDAWNQVDYAIYRQYPTRFASEFGHQAPPTYATIAQSIPAEQHQPASSAMLHHQKANGGQDKLEGRLAEHFIVPDDFDDWLYLTQLNQVRALNAGVEFFRSQQPRCMGSLYWQINDCWPVTSWAAIDGYGRRKPLWYATRRFYADRLLTIQPEDDILVLYANNDSDEPWLGELTLRRMLFNGQVVSEMNVIVDVAARQNIALHRLPTLTRPDEFIVADTEEKRALWFNEIDQNLPYPQPDFEASLRATEPGVWQLQLTAHTLLRDMAIFADRLDPDARIDDQIITLLPGENHSFTIHSEALLTEEMLTQRPVFQCVNYFGKQS